jgi:hypothetical protein
MKPMPVLLLMFLLAGIVAYVGAQSAVVKQGKGNTKNDQYMTNEFYQTKPLTADSKVEKGSGKTSKHHIERLKVGKHNGPGPTVSADAMPEPERSRLQKSSATTDHSSESGGTVSGASQNNEGSGKVTSDVSGKRVHKPLTTTRKRK